MRPLAIAAALLVGFGTSYAICGPDPDGPPQFIACPGSSLPTDAAALAPVSLRSGCPANDAPLRLFAQQSSTGQWLVTVQPGVWVGLMAGPEVVDRCGTLEFELPFPDGTRRWAADPFPDIDRLAPADGYCIPGQTIPLPGPPALGPTTVRVRVVGETFAGEAELPAEIRD